MNQVLPGFFSLLAWAIFLGALVLAVVLGMILSVHWYRYAMNPSAATTGVIVYSAGSIVLLAMLLGAVIAAT